MKQILVINLLLIGCGTHKISNQNFQKIKEISYISSQDYFAQKPGEDDVLSMESMDRFSRSRLREFKKNNDPLARATAWCHLGEYEKGFEILDREYRTYKKNPAYWNQVGSCYLHSGDIPKAKLYYNKSRELNKNYAPPINNLGVIYERKGMIQEALDAFKKASRLSKNLRTPKFNMARLYLKYGMAGKARPLFEQLYRKNDADPDVVSGLATCRLMENKISAAVRLYESMDEEDTKNPMVSLNYSLALKMKGDIKQAKSVMDKMNSIKSMELRKYKEKVLHFVGDE